MSSASSHPDKTSAEMASGRPTISISSKISSSVQRPMSPCLECSEENCQRSSSSPQASFFERLKSRIKCLVFGCRLVPVFIISIPFLRSTEHPIRSARRGETTSFRAFDLNADAVLLADLLSVDPHQALVSVVDIKSVRNAVAYRLEAPG